MTGIETIILSNTIMLICNTLALLFNANKLWKVMDSDV